MGAAPFNAAGSLGKMVTKQALRLKTEYVHTKRLMLFPPYEWKNAQIVRDDPYLRDRLLACGQPCGPKLTTSSLHS